MDLTGALRFGQKNVVAVRCDSREDLNIPPFGGQLDALTYGGIYGVRESSGHSGRTSAGSNVGVNSQVFCNGRRMFHHGCGYTAFTVDLTGALRLGQKNSVPVMGRESSPLGLRHAGQHPAAGRSAAEKGAGLQRRAHLPLSPEPPP